MCPAQSREAKVRPHGGCSSKGMELCQGRAAGGEGQSLHWRDAHWHV